MLVSFAPWGSEENGSLMAFMDLTLKIIVHTDFQSLDPFQWLGQTEGPVCGWAWRGQPGLYRTVSFPVSRE